MKPIVVKDNFFENPEQVINISKSVEWLKPDESHNWCGLRSPDLSKIDTNLNWYIVSNFLYLYYNKSDIKVDYTHVCFHKINKEDWLNRKEYAQIHQDGTELAGVIYLDKEHNFNNGTSIYNNEDLSIKVGSKFNRLVAYDGNFRHGISDLENDERLSIVVFLNNIKVR